MNRLHEFIDTTRHIFIKRGYEEIRCERTSLGVILLFVQNKALHLVYCFPCEMYVTTIEVRACWEAQGRFATPTSSLVAPYRFSRAAIEQARLLRIELVPLEAL